MLVRSVNYYQDGMITVLLYNEVAGTRKPRGVKPFERAVVAEYLSFPATTQVHIYCIDNENFEEVLALVRFIKSLYDIPVFCYYNSNLNTGSQQQLGVLSEKLIQIGV